MERKSPFLSRLTGDRLNLISCYGLAVFWGLWSLLVTITDTVNLLQVFNIVPSSFVFSSQNFALLSQVTAIYGLSYTVNLSLYLFIVAWVSLASMLYARFLFFLRNKPLEERLNGLKLAFLVSFSQTAFFILGDELFLDFNEEHWHVLRFTCQLVSFIFFLALEKNLIVSVAQRPRKD